MSNRKGLVSSWRWNLLGATVGTVAVTGFAWFELPYFSAVLVTVGAFAATSAIGAGYRRLENAPPGNGPPVRRMHWSRRASVLSIAIGGIAVLLGGAWTLFGPAAISPGDYNALRACKGDPIPTDGSCYSLAAAQVTGIWQPPGALYINVSRDGATQDIEIMDLQTAAAFGRGGTVELKYWRDQVADVQVPGTSTFAVTWNSPSEQYGLSRIGMFILLSGVLFLVVGVARWPGQSPSPVLPVLPGDPTIPLERAPRPSAARAMSVGWFSATVVTTALGFLIGAYAAFNPNVKGNDPIPAGLITGLVCLILALAGWWLVTRKKLLT